MTIVKIGISDFFRLLCHDLHRHSNVLKKIGLNHSVVCHLLVNGKRRQGLDKRSGKIGICTGVQKMPCNE